MRPPTEDGAGTKELMSLAHSCPVAGLGSEQSPTSVSGSQSPYAERGTQ